jgi:hypothetical protein
VAQKIKTLLLKATHENPCAMLHKDWSGHVVLATESPMTPMVVTSDTPISIPLMEPKGPISRERELKAIHSAFEGYCHLFLIVCETPAGKIRQGFIAVPRFVALPHVKLT